MGEYKNYTAEKAKETKDTAAEKVKETTNKLTQLKKSAAEAAHRTMNIFSGKKEEAKETTEETAEEAMIKYKETEDNARRKMEEMKLGKGTRMISMKRVEKSLESQEDSWKIGLKWQEGLQLIGATYAIGSMTIDRGY
ncbi:hypothetical protein AQUCO_06400003v1 [Aquilegia coerulea]|uniref:Uncharacterized protein n=1 Tax=Aquilegia coerulea TaxID=218851 RepID=A0A2G5CCE1_AQUCA|nr:hypothetical protein AQUCO_06400003v1 [Aquilegia coerulea]